MERPVKRGSFFDECHSLYHYEDEVAEAIKRFKFRGCEHYAVCFGSLLAMELLRRDVEFDYITWAPVSRRRRRKRGYDQAQLLAKQIAAELRKKDVLTLEQAKAKRDKGEKLTREEIIKLNNFIVTMAAYWSLQANIRQNHHLVLFYLEAMVVRKEYVDNTAGSLLVSVLKKTLEKNNKTTSAAEEKRNKQKEL